MQLVDDGSVTVKELNSPAGAVTVDGKARFGQVSNDVDAVFSKEVHTVIVAV